MALNHGKEFPGVSQAKEREVCRLALDRNKQDTFIMIKNSI